MGNEFVDIIKKREHSANGWVKRKVVTFTVELFIKDDTLPGRPRERTIVYKAPFVRCDREKDYDEAWKIFDKRNNNVTKS